MNAIMSSCEFYRYRLERTVSEAGPIIAYFGVNPSTADHTIDDHTVRKWRGFTAKLGGSRFIVGNVFAYRATDVVDLRDVSDPLGPDNYDHQARIIAEADILIPCWGRISKVPARLRHHFEHMEMALREVRKPLLHFGLTQCGCPKHPLTLGYNTPMLPWEAALTSETSR